MSLELRLYFVVVKVEKIIMSGIPDVVHLHGLEAKAQISYNKLQVSSVTESSRHP